MMSRRIKKLFLGLLVLMMISCRSGHEGVFRDDSRLKVVTTTTMITDLVSHIGGDSIQLTGLMGAGVDPHSYKASEGDVIKIGEADLVFYNGLHLEGRMNRVFEKMNRAREKTVALAENLPPGELLESSDFAENYDPHVWFDISLWRQMAEYATEVLSNKDPGNRRYYMRNLSRYLKELKSLDKRVRQKIEILDESQRILVTAHDAFGYFGRAFSFQVKALQGLSTATEAGVNDLRQLAEFIASNKIKAVFVETSVPRKTIEALRAAVRAKGHDVSIGGSLYSDALGTPGTPEGTFTGMYKHNVNTIVDALK